ncbi:GNAT family N-acetyltransferase, partial [Nocardia elegans]
MTSRGPLGGSTSDAPTGAAPAAPGSVPLVRRARTSDVPEIKRLVDVYAGRILLEKSLVTLYEAVQEFWVAELDGRVVGCGALHVLWADLGEVRTVAVHPDVKGRGVGRLIVQRLIEVARELELRRLFVLTFEV